MVLSGKSINHLIAENLIRINPPPVTKECSIKINLSGYFGKNKENLINLEEYTLGPKEFILVTTLEDITLPDNIAGLYDGWVGLSSSGVITHMGSMLIDPGFSGHILLEIFNASDSPVVLKQGSRVGQLMFLEVK